MFRRCFLLGILMVGFGTTSAHAQMPGMMMGGGMPGMMMGGGMPGMMMGGGMPGMMMGGGMPG